MTTYGFLGIGIMGQAMAANLLHAGLAVTVWNRTTARCQPLIDMGATLGQSPAEVVAASDVTFAMVSDPAAARDLCFGENGILHTIADNKGYIDVSTVDPETAMALGQAISARGGRYLEAPVSGSKKPAEDGQLVFLCGGDRSLYDQGQEAMAVMGKKTFYFGEAGQAAKMKLIINMIMGSVMTAFAEGLALGEKAGLPMQDILDVLGQGAINNPMFQLKGPLMAKGVYTPAFPLKHMQKDMRLALLLGDSLAQPLGCSGAANTLFLEARKQGFGDEDFSAVLKAIIS